MSAHIHTQSMAPNFSIGELVNRATELDPAEIAELRAIGGLIEDVNEASADEIAGTYVFAKLLTDGI